MEFATGQYVRRERARRNWSQEELGKRVGLSGGMISRIETGQKPITSMTTLIRLCEELAIGFDDLLILAIDDYRMREGG
ncbi:helix-turn-helix domain-containing protein [Amycolatopsis sp. lyj-84]|uniref:helix-turn-helix domain-containing protein n=1 Tax=Amycolatopsis sp. lyj-84 TaxID=2789284 RepID=UPI00397A74A6